MPTGPHNPIRLLAALLALGGLAACASRPGVSADRARALAALEYPEKADRGDELDIQVVQRGRERITITNRTSRRYGPVQLWLNQQYVRKIERIPVGATLRMHLSTFVNRHKEGFPVGGFLAPEDAEPVISAELYRPDAKRIHPLPVRLREGWDRFY